MKRQLGGALITVLNRSGTARWKRRSSATVFCYHNVVPDTLSVVGGEGNLHILLRDFTDQMEWIRKAFTVVTADELIDRLRRNKPVGGLAVLTFDDGYAGVVRNGVPVMKHLGFPYTLFPVTRGATERTPFWWDLADNQTHREREHRVTELMGDSDLIAAEGLTPRNLPDDMLPASWEMLKPLMGADCTIGVHGVTHRSLCAIPREEVKWELTGARDRIATELGVHVDIVAYPYGRSNEAVHEETKRAGFKAGMSTQFGLVRPGVSLHNVSRVNVPAGIPLDMFACWASGLKLPGT